MDERRQHERFWMEPGTLAGSATSDMCSIKIAGEVVDLSEVGLSLLYMTNRERVGMYSTITLFIHMGYYIELGRVQCRTIYDILIADSLSRCGVTARRCGVALET